MLLTTPVFRSATFILTSLILPESLGAADPAQRVFTRPGMTVVLEPYAPSIIRVNLSKDQTEAAGETRLWIDRRCFRHGLDTKAKPYRRHVYVPAPWA